MFRNFLLPVATLALVCEYALAQNNFINPPSFGVVHDYSADPVYHIGQTQNITWTTTFDQIYLVLWQNDNSTPTVLIDDAPSGQMWFEWPVRTAGTFNLNNGNVFFFEIQEIQSDNTIGKTFSSHYFNITNTPAPVSTTSSTISATSTTSSTASATSSSSSSRSGGLSTGADIGIGVGIGLAALAGILAGLFFFLRKRRSNGGTYSRTKGSSDTPPESGYAMEQGQQMKSHGAQDYPASPAPAPAAPAYTPYNPDPQFKAGVPPQGGYYNQNYEQQHLAEAPSAMRPEPAELSAGRNDPQELA